MIYTATVTQKGQVTIPIHIRKILGVKPYEKIAFKNSAHTITLIPVPDFLSMRGSIKSKKKYADNRADRKVLTLIKKEYEHSR